jgi:heme/copper-type cytochrome/quinol oxidase subunit 4
MPQIWQFLDQSFFEAFAFCLTLLVAVVHVSFAVAVFLDARRLPRKPILVLPIVWALATLLGGVFVAAVYWVMHHSRLNSLVSVTAPEDWDDSQDLD